VLASAPGIFDQKKYGTMDGVIVQWPRCVPPDNANASQSSMSRDRLDARLLHPAAYVTDYSSISLTAELSALKSSGVQATQRDWKG